MVYLGFEPRAAGWKAQTKPRSYGGRHINVYLRLDLVIIKLIYHDDLYPGLRYHEVKLELPRIF